MSLSAPSPKGDAPQDPAGDDAPESTFAGKLFKHDPRGNATAAPATITTHRAARRASHRSRALGFGGTP